MFRNRRPSTVRCLSAALLILVGAFAGSAQDRRSRIEVQDYVIDAELSPNTSTISATAAVRFMALDEGISFATFELNNALSLKRVVDDQGKQLQVSRNQQDFTIRVAFDPPLAKGKVTTVTFSYDGTLNGQEDSPVYGIKFAAIHPDFSFLLYPARWFPVSGYTTNRFGADMRVTVPMGYTVLGSGMDSHKTTGDKNLYEFKMERHSFPGSIAVVKDQPVRVSSEGITTAMYLRGPEAELVQQYGTEVGKLVSYFTGTFGLAPYANLTVVETEGGAPNGYAAPGMMFLSPPAITRNVNSNLLANEVSRQWWEEDVSPATRNHLWLTNGMAAYSELLWAEHNNGEANMTSQLSNVMVTALTVDNIPVIQSARLEDYSPELWALTGYKGAAVMNMLRYTIGDAKFQEVLKQFAERYSFKSAATDDFRKVVDDVTGKSMDYFFIQWIESSGAPEFRLEYTIYRVGTKGYRVMGKIAQDLDTFRMPVDLRIETEGNPETQRVEVVGTSSEFSVDTFGKPKSVVIDPDNKVLRYSPDVRVAVAIKRGEQFFQLSSFSEALNEYQKALQTTRNSSLAHYRIAEVYFIQGNWQPAANEFREALNGDLQPKWTEVWAHINLGKIFDVAGQRDRAVNEYNLAIRTKDNTQNAQDEASKYLKTAYERTRRPEQ